MNEYSNVLLAFADQVRVYHWMTTSYSQHEALGGLYDGISGLIDSFIETYMGKYGRGTNVETSGFLISYSLDSMTEKMDEFEQFLVGCDLPDTDLLNIRDEILALVHKTKYLLTLA